MKAVGGIGHFGFGRRKNNGQNVIFLQIPADLSRVPDLWDLLGGSNLMDAFDFTDFVNSLRRYDDDENEHASSRQLGARSERVSSSAYPSHAASDAAASTASTASTASSGGIDTRSHAGQSFRGRTR